MLARIAYYISYFILAKGLNRVHSPFVFSLYTEIILAHKQFYAFAPIEKIRARLLKSNQVISDLDPGAGSKKATSKKYIKSIAKNSLLPPWQGQLLFALTDYFKPSIILELGTSLGISALYLAKANNAQVHTIEGQTSIANIARQTIAEGKARNVVVHDGLFEEVLPSLLPKLQKIDLLYLDGNHTYEATLRYFNQLLPYLHNESVIIVDDIRWSKEMMTAWKTLITRDDIHVSIDLQKFGILFFRNTQVKEHFILRV